MNSKWTRSLLATTALVLVGSSAFAAEINFTPVPFAATDAQKRSVIASESVDIDGQKHPIGFNVLARSGDKFGDVVFAALIDKDGKPVKSADGSTHISVDADFTSLLPVGNKLFSITHFESRPGAMYLSELARADNGALTIKSTKPIDFSAVGGLWVPCAGSVTPWGTHLGSEEYPPDARAIEAATSMDKIDDYAKPMVRFAGLDPATATIDEFKAAFNPFAYGYPTEIAVKEDGSYTVAKHYAMGRVAVELAKVMPDQKTAYISDDGTNVGLFMFIADNAGDLSAGKLYAAKWNQTSADGAGAADLSWVDLGHADSASVAKALKDGVEVLRPVRDGRSQRRRHLPGRLRLVQRRGTRRVPESEARHGDAGFTDGNAALRLDDGRDYRTAQGRGYCARPCVEDPVRRHVRSRQRHGRQCQGRQVRQGRAQ